MKKSEIKLARVMLKRIGKLRKQLHRKYIKYTQDFEADQHHPLPVLYPTWVVGERAAIEMRALLDACKSLINGFKEHP